MVRDLEREGALPHRGPGGEDHEVGGLEAGGELVEVLEAAGEPGDVGARPAEGAAPPGGAGGWLVRWKVSTSVSLKRTSSPSARRSASSKTSCSARATSSCG